MLLHKNNLQDPSFSLLNKIIRLIWSFVYYAFFRFTPTPFFGFRRLILRVFGAKLSDKVNVYPSVSIWLPSNLVMGDRSTLGPHSRVYNQGKVVIGSRVTVSQYAHICASSHDYCDPSHQLILSPVFIDDDVWICADAFVGPGVSIGAGAVVGARGVLTSNADAWSVYAGNPAKLIKKRSKFGYRYV
ncbi:MAG: putative colanic acid biosynthesis acetyltransferase [Dehalococcoidales bacterium]